MIQLRKIKRNSILYQLIKNKEKQKTLVGGSNRVFDENLTY